MTKKRRGNARKSRKRQPLNEDRIIAVAIAIADAQGLAALSMRAVAEALDVQAMSLYNHVASKDKILDGMVDAVFASIEVPTSAHWRTAMRTRARTMYKALRAHPWAVGLLDARRSPGIFTLRHHDATIGVLRAAGFRATMVTHTLALLDAYVYGFALQELSLPLEPGEDVAALTQDFIESTPMDTLPNVGWLAAEQVQNEDYAFSDEFDYGLDLVLDGIERRVEEAE